MHCRVDLSRLCNLNIGLAVPPHTLVQAVPCHRCCRGVYTVIPICISYLITFVYNFVRTRASLCLKFPSPFTRLDCFQVVCVVKTISQRVVSASAVWWGPLTQPPRDTPECGFHNECLESAGGLFAPFLFCFTACL